MPNTVVSTEGFTPNLCANCVPTRPHLAQPARTRILRRCILLDFLGAHRPHRLRRPTGETLNQEVCKFSLICTRIYSIWRPIIEAMLGSNTESVVEPLRVDPLARRGALKLMHNCTRRADHIGGWGLRCGFVLAGESKEAARLKRR